MWSKPNPVYRLLDKDYPETFDSYVPQKADFYDVVLPKLPSNWEIERQGIWYYCSSPQNAMPQQGWKIHVSSVPANACEILDRVTSVILRDGDTNFKFALDMTTLLLLNGKNWSRSGSGKFITIYPLDNRRFLTLIEEIYAVTQGFCGPYILSDHRYQDSRVVYYRYGGMRLHEVLNIKGEKIPMLQAPGGTHIPDQRRAYPVTPSWAESPLPLAGISHVTEKHLLANGRYQIECVVGYSNAGGVYRALDEQTGKKVIIKEARPHVNTMFNGYGAIEMLMKEYRLLVRLSDTGIAPQPVDLFQEWEHWFLVEEYIDGMLMSAHSAAHNVLLRTRPKPEDYQRWYETFRSLCASLARISAVLHSRNIVFADLSTSNLIVPTGTCELKVIDFEGACQVGEDPPSTIYTPGFVSPERLAGGAAGFEDDLYAMGAVLLAYLFPLNGFFHLKPEARREIAAAIQRDAHLPVGIAEMLLALMSDEPWRRPSPVEIPRLLASIPERCEPGACDEPQQHDYASVIHGILDHIEHVTTYKRQNRLFPADPKVFATNPLSLAYGAAGVIYAVHKIRAAVPQPMMDWLLRHKVTSDTYAPGLYVGISGISWALLEMGAIEEAKGIFQISFKHPLLHESADLFYGTAGWGMTCLRFFGETGDEFYLDLAKLAGKKLLENSERNERGRCWVPMSRTTIGLASGSTGIGLFLLYLFLASGDEEILGGASDALEFDLSFGRKTIDGGLSWAQSVETKSILYPYWRFGSAGIGMATLRFYRLMREPRHRSILDQILIDTDRKYAVFPGLFMGLTGLGEFLLDMHDTLGDPVYLERAANVAEGIMNFRVERSGTAFPGDMLSRLCCDYGTGSAGVALFLNRLSSRQTSNFMLDSLYCSRDSQQSWECRDRASLVCTQ